MERSSGALGREVDHDITTLQQIEDEVGIADVAEDELVRSRPSNLDAVALTPAQESASGW